ncbi:ArsR family transcriptional regulator [Candidatus Bathyarchaeota archaeon]|nr:MAG: ArsR family transcriptional regulator [Candidatus Bathyarchaeota archaeon]
MNADREKIDVLKREINELKKRLDKIESAVEKERTKTGIEIRIEGFKNDIIEGLMNGIRGEIEKSVLISPSGIYVRPVKKGKISEKEKLDHGKIASVMRVLSNEHRLKILSALMNGGKYASDLEQKIHGISASALSSHLKILEETGLIVQESVRGRYLITIPGRVIMKTINRLARLLEEGEK